MFKTIVNFATKNKFSYLDLFLLLLVMDALHDNNYVRAAITLCIGCVVVFLAPSEPEPDFR
jgi:hypothetical protein